MAPNVKSAKKVFVFLGKSIFSLLETAIFTLIPKPRKNVAGEIVLITGAGSGLGRLLALQFARLGAVLVLWDINTEGNEETCKMARDAGATRAYAYTCDCSRKEEVYRVADQVKKEVGDISILINNAGIVTGKNFLNCPDELMEKSFDVNFKAHLWTHKAFLPAMIANAHGHLVCIASSAGLFGVNGLAVVATSEQSKYDTSDASDTSFGCVRQREGGAHLHAFPTPNFSIQQIEDLGLPEVKVIEDSKLKTDTLLGPLSFF